MVASIETKAAVKQILLDLTPYLDEKQKRILYGSAASALGHGGISFVNEITGSARNTITSGMNETSSPIEEKTSQEVKADHIRKPGAGEKVLLKRIRFFMKKLRKS